MRKRVLLFLLPAALGLLFQSGCTEQRGELNPYTGIDHSAQYVGATPGGRDDLRNYADPRDRPPSLLKE